MYVCVCVSRCVCVVRVSGVFNFLRVLCVCGVCVCVVRV